jgi:hypothetical protein
MGLKLKIFLFTFLGLFFLLIVGWFLAYRVSYPTPLHDMACRTQRVLHISLPIFGIPPNYTNICYEQFALKFSNPIFCTKTKSVYGDTSAHDSCYDMYARTKLNAVFCKNIIDLNNYNNCVRDIAQATKNTETCNLIKDFPPKTPISKELFFKNCVINASKVKASSNN